MWNGYCILVLYMCIYRHGIDLHVYLYIIFLDFCLGQFPYTQYLQYESNECIYSQGFDIPVSYFISNGT